MNLRVAIIGVLAGLTMLVAWVGIGLRGIPFLLVELAAIGAMLGANRLYAPQSDRWLRGAEGERDVGAICTKLETGGWHAIHDVSLGLGNVDHILIGRGGIFSIETKSHRGRISIDRIDPRMLKQAYAQKKLLERITGLDVQPLLVFSQAWLGGSVPTQRKGVTILPARLLQHYFSRRRPTLDTGEAEGIYQRLAAALSNVS